jgi:hypothetical protein
MKAGAARPSCLTVLHAGFIRMWNLNDKTEQPQVLLADDGPTCTSHVKTDLNVK